MKDTHTDTLLTEQNIHTTITNFLSDELLFNNIWNDKIFNTSGNMEKQEADDGAVAAAWNVYNLY